MLTLPLLAGVLGGCAWVRCVRLGMGLGLLPASLVWKFRIVCVFVCALQPTPPLLVCVVGVGVWVRVWLRPATPGWVVEVCGCLCARSACTRRSWLGYVLWVCLLGLGFRLRPATPGRGLGWVCLGTLCAVRLGFWLAANGSSLGFSDVCVFVPALCPTLPLLATVCGVGVWVRTRVSAAPRHSWLGCWGVCVFVCVLRLYPATPGGGVRCGLVCFGSGFGCAPPLVAGVLRCVCVFVCVLRLYPATPGWSVWSGCVRLRSGFGCAPPPLAGVLGCMCACVRAPLVPRHS